MKTTASATRTRTIIPLTPMKLTSPLIPRRPQIPPPLNTKTAPAAAIAIRNAASALPAKKGALPTKGAAVMPAIVSEPEVVALMPTAAPMASTGPNWAVIAVGLALGGWAFAYVYRSRAQSRRSTM